jgi:hypothetical protein
MKESIGRFEVLQEQKKKDCKVSRGFGKDIATF